MKKLLALFGSITLTASIGAVSIVSCGMAKMPIEFKIEGIEEKDLDKIIGSPKSLAMNILELLTFNTKKYNNDEKKLKKVYENLNEEIANKFNLYTLSEGTELNERLNTINNDGIKEFEFIPSGIVDVDKKDFKFTIIEESYEKDKGSTMEVMGPKSLEFLESVDANDIWGIKAGEKDNTSKTNFVKAFSPYKELKIFGEWESPEITSINQIIEPKDKYKYEFKEKTDSVDFFFSKEASKNKGEEPPTEEPPTEEPPTEEPSESGKYEFADKQMAVSEAYGMGAKIKYGDLKNKGDNEDIDISVTTTGLRTIMSPVKYVASDDKDNGKRVIIITWIPNGYTFAKTQDEFINKKNVFGNIEVSLG